MQTRSVAFVGMTHLGLVSAIGAASKGYNITCFDFDESLIQSLRHHKLPVNEPLLSDLFEKNSERLYFTANIHEVAESPLIYISPDVKTDDSGNSDLSELNTYVNRILQTCSGNENILVILSQVPPGFTSQLNWDKAKLFYQVETLIFGQAVERSLYPERYTVGVKDTHQPLPSVLEDFLSAYGCPIVTMNYESAELSKIAINLFLISSLTTTNMIAGLCEKIGANWYDIIKTLRLDKRIGKHAYLMPGLGFAGGNLERDMNTFYHLSQKYGTDASMVDSWKQNNTIRKNRVLKEIYHQILPLIKTPTFGILGLAYKKDTASIKNSPSVNLLNALNRFPKKVFDPVVKQLPPHLQQVTFVNTAQEAINDVDALLIMTPWDEFKALSPKNILASLRGKTILDPYGVLDKEACMSQGLNYFRLGI